MADIETLEFNDYSGFKASDLFRISSEEVQRFVALILDPNKVHSFSRDAMLLLRAIGFQAPINFEHIMEGILDVRIAHGSHVSLLGQELLPEDLASRIVIEQTNFKSPLVTYQTLGDDTGAHVISIVEYVESYIVKGNLFHRFNIPKYLLMPHMVDFSRDEFKAQSLDSLIEGSTLLNEHWVIASHDPAYDPRDVQTLASLHSKADLASVYKSVVRAVSGSFIKAPDKKEPDADEMALYLNDLAALSLENPHPEIVIEAHELNDVAAYNALLHISPDSARYHHASARIAGSLVRLLEKKNMPPTALMYKSQDCVFEQHPGSRFYLMTVATNIKGGRAKFHEVIFDASESGNIGKPLGYGMSFGFQRT